MVIISNKYKIIKNLGEGAFGKVFECQIIKKDINAAIKIQPKDLPNVLKNEAKIYKFLNGINGVPKLFNLGMFDGYNYLVIEKFKETIEKIELSFEKQIFYFKQAIDILKNIHDKGLVHRDIKPENLMLDVNGNINFIDFGLSKLIISNKIHISLKEGKSLIGTAKYCSINSHKGYELSRRDDIESLIYTFAFLKNKTLPWDEISCSGEKSDVQKKILDIKDGKNLDFKWLELNYLLLYLKTLDFTDEPNYRYIKCIIENSMILQ